MLPSRQQSLNVFEKYFYLFDNSCVAQYKFPSSLFLYQVKVHLPPCHHANKLQVFLSPLGLQMGDTSA